MENSSYEHTIEEVIWSDLLNKNTCQKCRNIVGITAHTSFGIPYRMLRWWCVAEQVLVTTFEWKKIVIKIGKKQKLLLDAEREIFVWSLVPNIVPCIIEKWEKKLPTGDKYWVVQEYIPGEVWSDYLRYRHLTDYHKRALTRTLGKLHQTIQSWELFFWRAGPWARKKYKTFSEYIWHFEQYIEDSDHFPSEIKKKILRGISYFKQKVSWEIHIPCLIHGDFQERNILISDDENCSLIDFWDVKWSLKEAEFATMLSHISEPGMRIQFSQIIETYEKEFWILNKNLLDLFLICCGSYKIIQRQEDYRENTGIWKTFICPILDQIGIN